MEILGRAARQRRRVLLVLATTVTALTLGGGVALAAGDACASDPCYGTDGPDVLVGTHRGETIEVFGGDDFVKAEKGKDTVRGGRGNDRIAVVDGQKDVVDCGKGNADTVHFDLLLDKSKNCEITRPDIPIIS